MAFHPSTGGIGALGALNKASVSGVGEPMSTDALIANLIGMTPAERQQFASINANDPMKLSAAKYVDNQLKTQASQLVAQQNRTAPPPVNQQTVASMAGASQGQPAPQQMAQGLPEETGIGALPVPEMKHMAAGGIVAFADGGFNSELFRKFLESVGKTGSDFANADSATKKGLMDAFGRATSGPQLPPSAPVTNVPAAAPVNPYAPATPGTSYADTKSPLQRLMSGPKGNIMGALAVPAAVAYGGGKLSSAAANTLNAMSDEDLGTLSNVGGGDDTALAAAILREGRNNPTPATPAKPGDYRGSKDVPYTGSGVPSASAAAARSGASTQAGANAQAARAAAPQSDTGAGAGAGAGVPRTGAGTAPSSNTQTGMPNAAATYAGMLKQLPPTVVPQEYRDIEQLQVEQANKGLESDQAAAAKLQEYLGKRGERLDQRAARLKDKSDNDINMSLIDAGLAMMQSRGQGLAGIAEGAGVGMKRYTEESRLTEAARQKIEEARDAYDDLKFNREDMSRKEILARKKEISDAHIALKKNNVDYMVAHEGMDRKTADHMYDSAMNFALEGQRQQYQSKENVLDRANRLQAAAAPLNAQLGILSALGNAEPGSPIAKGFKLQKLEAQEPAMFKNYIDLVNDPIKGDKFKAQYPDFSSYLADFNKRGGIAALPGGGGAATAPVVLPR